MEIYMPTKEEWEALRKSISDISESLEQFKILLKRNNPGEEHFPEYMDIVTAAKYLKCPVSRIKNMIYKQKLLQVHHIDLTTTAYVSKKEMDELPHRVSALNKMEKKNERKP